MLSNIFKAVFSDFKNAYGRFAKNSQGFSEYYLQLDEYYFCNKQKCIMLVVQVRNKRTVYKVSVQETAKDKYFIKELHPRDACIIGMLANMERNENFNTYDMGSQKINRFRRRDCFIKSEPLLKISKKYINEIGEEISVLTSSFFDKEISISTVELSNNEALIYALDQFQAISIGYDCAEIYNRKIFSMG